MSPKYIEGFKIQAVEKALNRSPEISLTEMAKTLGISRSALQRWITQSKNHQLENISDNTASLTPCVRIVVASKINFRGKKNESKIYRRI
jgi:transposase-like protein